MGSTDSRMGPKRSAIIANCGPWPVSPAKSTGPPVVDSTKPAHSAADTSVSPRLERCCAGTAVTVRPGATSVACHQSSSTTRPKPSPSSSALLPRPTMKRGRCFSSSRRSVGRSMWS